MKKKRTHDQDCPCMCMLLERLARVLLRSAKLLMLFQGAVMTMFIFKGRMHGQAPF